MYAFRCTFEDVHVVFSDAVKKSEMLVETQGCHSMLFVIPVLCPFI